MGCILIKKTIIDVSNQLASQKQKVVFTHGAFDLFHLGHSELFRHSKKKGDYLIVGLESDERISRYKGISRPFMSLEERLEVIKQHKQVDFVFAIEGPKVNDEYYVELYEKLAPKIITMGKSFAYIDRIEKRKELVKSKFVAIRHFDEGIQSTTNLIEKIKNS